MIKQVKKLTKLVSAVLLIVMLMGCVACAPSTPYKGVRFKKYVDLGNTTVTLKKSDIETLFNDELQTFLKNYADKKTVDRKVQKGDNVTVDTEIYILNDKGAWQLFDDYVGASGDDSANLSGYTIEDVGSGEFLEEIENAIIGAVTLEECWADVEYDDKVQTEQLKNKKARIKITVKKIEELTYPDYCDEFIASKTEYKTVAEFEEDLRRELTRSLMWNTFAESCTIKGYPEDKIKAYQDEYYAFYESYATYYGKEFDAYVKEALGLTLEEFEKNAVSYSQGTVKEELILYYLVKKNKIRFTDEEYKTYAESVLSYYECDSVEKLEETYSKELIERNLYWELAKDMLYEKLVITEDTTT